MGRAEVVRDYGGVSADDRRAERRRKLVEAGRRIWGESGISEVSVRGVCGASGLTPRYFYEHFANRDELLVAVAEEVQNELVEVLVTVSLNEPGDLAHKLRPAFQAFLDLVASDPHVHRIATSVMGGISGFGEQRARLLDTVTALVLEYGPGLLGFAPPAPDETRRGALFIVGGILHVIDTWMHDPRETTEELAAACTELCLAVVSAGAAKAARVDQ